MSQSIRSGKSAAPYLSLSGCFAAIANALQGQKLGRVSRALQALAELEERIKELRDTIAAQKMIIAMLEKDLSTGRGVNSATDTYEAVTYVIQ